MSALPDSGSRATPLWFKTRGLLRGPRPGFFDANGDGTGDFAG